MEEPRRTPVPKRFTFDALNSASRQARKESEKEEKKDAGRARSDSTNSVSSNIDLLKEVEKVKTVVDVVDWRFYSTGLCICLLNLVAAWDATSLAIVLPTIAATLGGSALQSFWLVISFLLAATVFSPLFATLSNILGRKPLLLTALTFLTCGSFIAAVSGNFTGLYIGRTIQGIGAGGIAILSNLIVSDLVSAVDRRKWSGILGAIWAIGIVTGPVIGDALAERSRYRWVFWVNLPFSLLAFLILPFFAQLKPASPGPIVQKIRNVDWVGFVLLSGALASVLLGLTWGGTNHAWSNFRTILPLQFGFIGLVVFGIWSWFSPFASIVSIDGLDATSLATLVQAVVQGLVVFGSLYILPLYFNIAKPNLSLVGAGIRLLPWTLPLAVFALGTFFLLGKTKYVRPAIWTAWILITIGIALLVLVTRKSSAVLWGCAVVSGSGVGILYPSLHISSQLAKSTNPKSDGIDVITATEEVDHTSAVTRFTFFQFLGQTLGVTIGFTVFQNRFLANLTANETFKNYAVQYVKGSVALVTRVPLGENGSPAAEMVDVYVHSLRAVWIVMAALAGTTLLVSLFMKEKEMARSKVPELIVLDEAYIV